MLKWINKIGVFSVANRIILFVIFTTILSVFSVIAIYIVIENHKAFLIDDLSRKSKYASKSIQKSVEIDLFFKDKQELNNKIAVIFNLDEQLSSVSFYDKKGEKITGNSKVKVTPVFEFNFFIDEIKNELILIQRINNSSNEIVGFSALGFSLDKIDNTSKSLRNKLVFIALFGILFISLLILYALNEIRESTLRNIKIENEVNAEKNKNDIQKSFLANMSHELRTPLNAINGFSKIIYTENTNPTINKYIRLIVDASDSMHFLVNDILDFSKIESGNLNFEMESFDFNDLFITTCQTLKVKVKDSVYFTFSNIPNDLTIVYGDYHRTKQVLMNIVNNAIKYTDIGRIEAGFTVREIEEFYIVKCVVKDTGIGIAEENSSSIFSAFQTVHDNKDRNIEGTGLGLAICSKLVGMMNGEIYFTSKLNEGSDFVFEIPLPKGNKSDYKTSVKKQKVVNSIRMVSKILVAEDNKINQLLIQTILKKWGAEITSVFNGEEAILKLKNESFDLILMDIQMPVMGGVEAVLTIRNSDLSQKSIPIIALTANAVKGSKEEYLSYGMNGYVTKPIDEELLANEISRVCEGLII
jgi:signal transduction histidine kinase/ActR/RegA family two-component response regulator